MGEGIEAEPERTDADTMMVSLADGLLASAMTLRGLASDRSDGPDCTEGRVQRELAGHLEMIARRLDLLRASLCERCRLREVVVSVAVESDANAEPPPQKARRRRKPR